MRGKQQKHDLPHTGCSLLINRKPKNIFAFSAKLAAHSAGFVLHSANTSTEKSPYINNYFLYNL